MAENGLETIVVHRKAGSEAEKPSDPAFFVEKCRHSEGARCGGGRNGEEVAPIAASGSGLCPDIHTLAPTRRVKSGASGVIVGWRQTGDHATGVRQRRMSPTPPPIG